jgi:hypothetical protein
MPQQLHERPRASPLLDDAASRRAHIRAIAAGIVDAPRMGRRFHVPAGVPLQPSSRKRRHGARLPRPEATPRQGRSHVRRRVIAGAFLLLQVGALAALLTAPAFKVHSIEVTGDHLLSRDAVLAEAHVPQSSLFVVDGDAIRARVARLPWVRSVTVSTRLPSTVQIAVTEWQPDVLLRHSAATTFVAGNGATLPLTPAAVAAARDIPVVLDYRPGDLQAPLPGLADLLASAAQRWPTVLGCKVTAFEISSAGVLSIWSSTGWKAVLGTLDSVAALNAIPGQLQALVALHGHGIDATHPTFGYVDVQNPLQPALGGKPGLPATLVADLAAARLPVTTPAPASSVGAAATSAATPTPSAAPTATATPAPTPRPSPTPVVFGAQPTPSTSR